MDLIKTLTTQELKLRSTFPARYKWPTSLMLEMREMQIKTIMNSTLTPVRVAIIKMTEITSVGEDVEK